MELEAPPPQTLDEALADIALRFLANLPEAEPPTVERLFMQIQQAHWFYEDFYVDEFGHLPHLNSYEFSRLMFERCPLLAAYKEQHASFMARFKEYIGSIPVFGCILMNPTLDSVLMVRGWHGKSWSFPKGKINQRESHADCAAREVDEEVGFNPRALIREEDFLSITNGAQFTKLFIVPGVPDDGSIAFAPRTRKEVSAVAWWPLDAVPSGPREPGASRFWAVRELLAPLKAWAARRRASTATAIGGATATAVAKKRSRRRKAGAGTASAGESGGGGLASSGADDDDDDSAAGGIFTPLEARDSRGSGGGNSSGGGWSVADMFKRNQELLGRQFTYDGNPHTFGDTRHSAAVVPLPAPPTTPAAATLAAASAAATATAATPGKPAARAKGKPPRGGGSPAPASASNSTAPAAAAPVPPRVVTPKSRSPAAAAPNKSTGPAPTQPPGRQLRIIARGSAVDAEPRSEARVMPSSLLGADGSSTGAASATQALATTSTHKSDTTLPQALTLAPHSFRFNAAAIAAALRLDPLQDSRVAAVRVVA